MLTEESLDALINTLRTTFPDHRATDFPTVYQIIREWFRMPIDDRRDEAFQLVIGPGSGGQPYLSFCRIFHRVADKAYIQSWMTLDYWSTDQSQHPGWTNHCWYGKDFPSQEQLFAVLEATVEFREAYQLGPWHVRVSWQRTGEGSDVATIMGDMHRNGGHAPKLAKLTLVNCHVQSDCYGKRFSGVLTTHVLPLLCSSGTHPLQTAKNSL